MAVLVLLLFCAKLGAKVQKINDIYKYFSEKELHGLQNCTSMQVQFMAIIYNIILYYYNEDFIKIHSYAILQFMQFMSMENALDAFFLKNFCEKIWRRWNV